MSPFVEQLNSCFSKIVRWNRLLMSTTVWLTNNRILNRFMHGILNDNAWLHLSNIVLCQGVTVWLNSSSIIAERTLIYLFICEWSYCLFIAIRIHRCLEMASISLVNQFQTCNLVFKWRKRDSFCLLFVCAVNFFD